MSAAAAAVHFNITAQYLQKSGFRPIYAGDSYDYGFRVVGPQQAAYDLNQCVLQFTAAKAAGSAAVLSLTSGAPGEISITQPTTLGQFTVHLGGAQTVSLAGTWAYDIVLTTQDGRTLHLTSGMLEILSSVTA